MSDKLFGTDGIRGKANVYPMTASVALEVGKSLGSIILDGMLGRKNSKKKVIIGKDTRLSCYTFEYAIASGLSSMGVDVLLVGPIPTPAVAWLTKTYEADAGVVISASHNHFEDNGIKIFGENGLKLSDELEEAIEKRVASKIFNQNHAFNFGKMERVNDATIQYVEHILEIINVVPDLTGKTIAIDCANGAGYKAAPLLFNRLGAQVLCIGDKPNGKNINEKVGALYPEKLQELIKSDEICFGLALDGDADRAIFIDEKGCRVNGDAILAVIAKYLNDRGELKQNTLVATEMSNMGLENCLTELGIKIERANVGDRYVSQLMRDKNYNLGGEESGHIILADHSTTGDGLLSGLLMACILQDTKQSLSKLASLFKPTNRAIINTIVSRKIPIASLPKSTALLARLTNILKPKGRLFVRYSGTENKLRVLVEGPKQSELDSYAKEITDCIINEIEEVK